jgi:cutinase
VGNLYAAKTIDECVPEDPICSPTGGDNGAHQAYAFNGMTAAAASFAADKVAAAMATAPKPASAS